MLLGASTTGVTALLAMRMRVRCEYVFVEGSLACHCLFISLLLGFFF